MPSVRKNSTEAMFSEVLPGATVATMFAVESVCRPRPGIGFTPTPVMTGGGVVRATTLT